VQPVRPYAQLALRTVAQRRAHGDARRETIATETGDVDLTLSA
jgi:hypothetical protein